MAVDSLLLPATRSTSPGRSVRRSESGSEGTNGSSPGVSLRMWRASLCPIQSRIVSKVVIAAIIAWSLARPEAGIRFCNCERASVL